MSKRPDYRSKEAEAYRSWYFTTAWRKKSKAQRKAHPLCAYHLEQGEPVPCNVADHIIPHKGDPDLFWNGELQSLCTQCHNERKQQEERYGYSLACDLSGRPLDPRHPANKASRINR